MTSPSKSRVEKRTDTIIAFGLMLSAFLVYRATLTPSLSFISPDGNELATIPYLLGLAHPTGYPLYTWLGKLFTLLPFGDIAHRMNLMSALMGAGAVGLLYAIVRILTEAGPYPGWISRTAAAFAALCFAFSRSFWSQSGIAEVYAPNIFMITLTLWLLLRWAQSHEAESQHTLRWLFGFALSFGLSLGTHMSNLGFAPGFALFILLIDHRFLRHPKAIGAAAAGFILGVGQFLWLPYIAWSGGFTSTMHPAPSTFTEIYAYTLGAFDQLKFAFPWWAIPDRIVIYLALLRQQVFLPGILVGLVGMLMLLFRRPRGFFLLIMLYITHLVFFLQYQVFDLDVFYIPAHMVFITFCGVAVHALLEGLWRLYKPLSGRWRKLVTGVGFPFLALALLLPLILELRVNWSFNDHSEDTAINDFYNNVWDFLPEGSSLLGRSGVMGFDMLYFPLIYDVRPDVTFLNLEDNTGQGELYTTLRPDERRAGGLGRNVFSREQQGLWYTPVLIGHSSGFLGNDRELVLYHATEEPPVLFVEAAEPDIAIEIDVGGIHLIGLDLMQGTAESGGRLRICLYWDNWESQLHQPMLVSTYLEDIQLESHLLGLGDLDRILSTREGIPFGILREEIEIIIPSNLAPGKYALSMSIRSPFEQNDAHVNTVDVGINLQITP